MTYFAEFLADGPVELFNKDSTDEELFEAADVIQKLHVIAQELSNAPRFVEAKKKISNKYDEIERTLIEKFIQAHRMEDVNLMREIATILSNFKSYSECVNAYIEESQMSTFVGKDIFRDALPLTEKNFALIQEVFIAPEQVMSKFVLNVYKCKLQNYIETTLAASKTDTEKYLTNLNDLYTKTVQLSKELGKFKLGSEDSYLSKLTHTVFQQYLDSYISKEKQWMTDKCGRILQKFYDSKAHQKKQVSSGGLQEIRREMQALVGTRANINIAQIEDYGGETFLSEEVSIAILEEAKTAFSRCQVLSRPSELANNASQIVEVLLDYLINNFVNYALEIGLQAVPIPETKSQPQEIHFFKVTRQTNMIVYLIEKNFADFALPLLTASTKHGEFLLKKKMSLQALEQKLENGIDRSLNAIIGWVKMILQNEQKKSDYKPESDLELGLNPNLSSQACLKVVKYMSHNIAHINECLDGGNRECVMTELGIRFHRVVYEHLQTFQYNSTGAMCLICDINEYRKCVRELKSNLVNTLFDTLHSLCNLLLVKPENLDQVRNGEHLAVLDSSILLNFIQLRSDYKSQKIASFLRGITA
uniref:Exocyst complex component 5 n=5 Tax=Lygus hesperus TaxID=30085 RepID=A0A0A9W0K1_LYGHE